MQESSWGTSSVWAFTVSNPADSALNWRVRFELPEGTTFRGGSGALIRRVGNLYEAYGRHWNSPVPPGGTATFTVLTEGTGTPSNCLLNGRPCDGGPPGPDTQPPSTPQNLRLVHKSGWLYQLYWTASTDDVAVNVYEVFIGRTSIGGTIGTEYEVSAQPVRGYPPPSPTNPWRIRAIDAAGNKSDFAIIALGQ